MITMYIMYFLLAYTIGILSTIFFTKNITTLILYSELIGMVSVPMSIVLISFLQIPIIFLLITFAMLTSAIELIIPALALRHISNN